MNNRKNFIIILCFVIICSGTLILNTLIEHYKIDSNKIYNHINTKLIKFPTWEEASDEEKCSYIERLFILSLHPYIQEAIDNYYTKITSYNNVRIISITPTGLNHIIVLEVETYFGPHNPPYGLDTITLLWNSSSAEVIDFKHKDVAY